MIAEGEYFTWRKAVAVALPAIFDTSQVYSPESRGVT
jgi:hypothetical protein